MCSLRDAATQLAELGAVVVGVSADTVDAVRAFHTAQTLPFPLLADPEGAVIRAWGVQRDGSVLAQRATFVIDPDGVVRWFEPKVNPQGHGAALVETLKSLQKR